jgi:hypothetical protein
MTLAIKGVSGKANASRDSAYWKCQHVASLPPNIPLTGVGTSAPVILSGGASRKSNAEDSQIWAMISDPTPNAEETLVSCHSEQHNKRTWESTLNSNQVVGLFDRGDDSLNVERTDRSYTCQLVRSNVVQRQLCTHLRLITSTLIPWLFSSCSAASSE